MKRQLKRLYRALFANRACRKFNILVFECSLHGLGIQNYENDQVSGEAHFIHGILPKLIEDHADSTLVDVGAHSGAYSQELVRVFPNSRVVSIEPHPQSYARLCDCLRNQVQPLQLALGSVCGEATLFDRDDCQGSEHASLQKEAITEHHKQGAHEVNVKIDKLDAVADRLGIESIDLLKVDTEGHEFDVLKGAESLLRRNAIRVIQFEFNAMNVYRRVFLRDMRKMLPHYRFYRLLPKSMIEVPEDPLRSELFGFQNVVCIHEDLAQQAAA